MGGCRILGDYVTTDSFSKTYPVLACVLNHVSCARLFATLWTVACQAPLSIGFSRQEYWSGLPFPFSSGSSRPRDQTCVSCIAGGFLTAEPPGEACPVLYVYFLSHHFELLHL